MSSANILYHDDEYFPLHAQIDYQVDRDLGGYQGTYPVIVIADISLEDFEEYDMIYNYDIYWQLCDGNTKKPLVTKTLCGYSKTDRTKLEIDTNNTRISYEEPTSVGKDHTSSYYFVVGSKVSGEVYSSVPVKFEFRVGKPDPPKNFSCTKATMPNNPSNNDVSDMTVTVSWEAPDKAGLMEYGATITRYDLYQYYQNPNTGSTTTRTLLGSISPSSGKMSESFVRSIGKSGYEGWNYIFEMIAWNTAGYSSVIASCEGVIWYPTLGPKGPTSSALKSNTIPTSAKVIEITWSGAQGGRDNTGATVPISSYDFWVDGELVHSLASSSGSSNGYYRVFIEKALSAGKHRFSMYLTAGYTGRAAGPVFVFTVVAGDGSSACDDGCASKCTGSCITTCTKQCGGSSCSSGCGDQCEGCMGSCSGKCDEQCTSSCQGSSGPKEYDPNNAGSSGIVINGDIGLKS